MAILTTAELDDIMGAGSSAYTAAQKAQAVAAANLRVESLTERTFGQGIISEWLTGSRTDTLVLTNAPVTGILRVGAGVREKASISQTLADLIETTIIPSPTGLRIAWTTTTGGPAAAVVTYDQVAPIPDIATLGELALVVNALGYGLSMVVEEEDAVSAIYPLIQSGGCPLYLPAEEIPSEVFLWQDRFLHCPQDWGGGVWGEEPLFVSYTYGYATVPEDVKQAAYLIAAASLSASQITQGLKSQQLGEWKWEVADNGGKAVPDEAMEFLAPYMRIRML